MTSDLSRRSRDRCIHRAAAVALAAAALGGGALAGCGGGAGATTAGQQPTPAGGRSATTTAAPRTTTTTTTSTGAGGTFGGGAAKGHTVADVLDAVLTSGDPGKACGSAYVTEHYLAGAYGGRQGCVNAQTSGSAAQSVEIRGLAGEPKPGAASVKVVPKGGVYDGEKLTVTLVKEGDDWKVDGVKSNAPVGP